MESTREFLNLGCFGQMGHQFHSILRTEFESEVRIEKFQGFLDSRIISESMESTREFLKESLEFLNSDGRIGFQGLKLSGKPVPFLKNAQKLHIYREIPEIPKNFRILGIF